MEQRSRTEINIQNKRMQGRTIPHNGKVRYDRKAESEFFVDNSALAGFTGERILYMAVRELIENALDSCEVNHILPKVSLSLKIHDSLNDMWIITCEDNGVGIPADKVPVAVCSFLTSGKYVERQAAWSIWRGPQNDCCLFLPRTRIIRLRFGREQSMNLTSFILNSELILVLINR